MKIEPLESRRLLSAVQVNGTFTGTEEHVVDGREVSETISVVATPGKGSVTNVALTIQDNVKTFSTVLAETFTGNPAKKHPTLSATIPSSIGSGTIQIVAGQTMAISATLATGIFAPLTFTFEGAATAGQSKSPANSADAESITPFATTAPTNPAIGFYIGHLTRASDSTAFTTKTTIRTNKLGHAAIDLLLTDPGFGSIEIASAIHPTHTGAFTLDLGTQAVDGILTGHVTHTGRLVLELNVAGFSSLTGTQKRH